MEPATALGTCVVGWASALWAEITPAHTPPKDHRGSVSRCRVDKMAWDTPFERTAGAPDRGADAAAQITMDEHAQFVVLQVQQAIPRGDFDNLPGAGKALSGLAEVHHRDCWIRRKIRREQLARLSLPALTSQSDDSALDARLDATAPEAAVREILDDFTLRVVNTRRHLQGARPSSHPPGMWMRRSPRGGNGETPEPSRTVSAEKQLRRNLPLCPVRTMEGPPRP